MSDNAPSLTEADLGLALAVTRGLAKSVRSEANRMKRLIAKNEMKSPGRELYWEGYLDGMFQTADELEKRLI